jgi:hypothetical protein
MLMRQVRAVFAGTLSTMVLGFVTYDLLLRGFFEANMGSATGLDKGMPVWWALTAGQVLWCCALVYVYQRGPAVETFAAGAKIGGLLGLLGGAWWNLSLFATINSMTLTGHIGDALATGVMWAISGGVIAVVLAMGKKA